MSRLSSCCEKSKLVYRFLSQILLFLRNIPRCSCFSTLARDAFFFSASSDNSNLLVSVEIFLTHCGFEKEKKNMNKTNTSQVCLLSKMLSKAELNSAFAPTVESFSFSELFLNLKLSKKETKYIHFFFHFS